jgi:chemotaxis protein CheX
MRADLGGGAVTSDALQGIVWQVWTAYLGGTPPGAMPPAAYAEQFDLTAAVAISGAWHGHVVLRCPVDGMVAIAATMLEMDGSGASLEDTVDAAGELMNIIAGNVKSLLPQPSLVALPQVVLGAADVVWPKAMFSCELRTAFDEFAVMLSVMEVGGSAFP